MTAEQIWKTIAKQRDTYVELPSWVVDILTLPLDQANNHAKILIEPKAVDPPYIAFLEEQISLAARDQEWTTLLERRKSSLASFVGKELIIVTISQADGFAWIRFDPQGCRTILVEVHSAKKA